MILFALTCLDGHRFESWFRNGESYDQQVAWGLIVCPFCQSRDVAKAVMAPAIVSRMPSVPSTAPEPSRDAVLIGEKEAELRTQLKKLREQVVRDGEDVGASFPEQARKMHDGAIPQRLIHGCATVEVVRELIDDGVPVLPLPPASDDLN